MKNRNSMFTTILLACFGFLSGAQAVVPAPDGGYPGGNTAEGQNALLSLTSGQHNTAVGYLSLKSDTIGGFNTAVGSGTLFANTADGNTATGTFALLSNTTGGTFAGTFGEFDVGPNTAIGTLALLHNTTGGANTAVGFQALGNMTIGSGVNLGGYSTAVGFKALASADTSSGTGGHSNDAFGYEALAQATTGFQNVGIGALTLFNNLAGAANTAVGHSALSNNTGNQNTALGYFAGADATTGSGNVYIGTNVEGSAGESDHTYIRNINTTTVSGGGTDTVTVNLSTGLLGHLSSSRRYKEEIKSMDSASEALYRLKPVTFRYKREIDQSQSLDYGLIAEEVARIDPNLANRNRDGQIESVRYTAINAMLLNEFLKEHKRVEEQSRKLENQSRKIQEQQTTVGDLKSTVAQQQKRMELLTAQLKEQAAQIQKVSAQVQASGPAPRAVVSNH